MNESPPVSRPRPAAARSRRGPAWLAALAERTGITPVGLLNRLDRLTPGVDGARRAARGIAYGPEQRQQLDVWVPTRRRHKGERLPVVVFFYGGGWNSGSRSDYGFAGAAFAGQGFVAVVPDYRLVPAVRFPGFVEDGALALRWARDHAESFGGDPDRITVAGHSAGAYIGAMLALDRRWLKQASVSPAVVKGGALLAGPYDFAPFTESRGRSAFGHWPTPHETQPISFVRKGAPPLLLAHGTADRVVFPRNSRHLAERLEKAGAPVTLKLYAGASHTDLVVALARPFRRKLGVLADCAAFLKDRAS